MTKEEYLWSESEIDFLKNNMSLSDAQLGKILKRTERGVKYKRLSMDLKRPKGKIDINRKYQVDQSFFEEINTHEKAYWLGFIWADGSIVRDALCISLHSKDEIILQKFKSRIKSEHPIKDIKGQNMKKIVISSKKICDDLNKLGVIPNKTNNFRTPQVPIDFIFSFFLGVFDGDGSIGLPTTFSICARPELAEFFKEKTITYLHNVKIYNIKNKSVKVIKVMNKTDLLALYSLLYLSEDFLPRKKEKFEALLRKKNLL